MTAVPKAKMGAEASESRVDARAESDSARPEPDQKSVASQRYGKLRWTIDFSHESPERQRERAKLLALLQEGIDSGMCDRTIDDIWEDVKARFKANGKLESQREC